MSAPLIKGHLYIVRTLTPPQRLVREHQLTFMDTDGYTVTFNARPYAGTQEFDVKTILSVIDVTTTLGGREDSRHYMNRVVR